MASIQKYDTKSGTRYMVRYRTPEGRQTDKRGFKLKRDAEAFAATLEVAKLKGDFVPSTAGRVTVGELSKTWLALKKGSVKPSYYRDLESSYETHVEPRWADVAIGSILPTAVQTWVNEIDRSATVVWRARGILSGILDMAVDDKLIAQNKAKNVRLPKKIKGKHAYLTLKQVDRLAQECGQHGDFVRFLALTGLRWGEAIALTGSDIDWRNNRITITSAAVTLKGGIKEGTPKTHERRSVPLFKTIRAFMDSSGGR